MLWIVPRWIKFFSLSKSAKNNMSKDMIIEETIKEILNVVFLPAWILKWIWKGVFNVLVKKEK